MLTVVLGYRSRFQQMLTANINIINTSFDRPFGSVRSQNFVLNVLFRRETEKIDRYFTSRPLESGEKKISRSLMLRVRDEVM